MNKKTNKRIHQNIMVVCLILVMVIQCLPINITCWESNVREAHAETLANPRTLDWVVTWDCVWFGNYPQNDATGATREPIKWRVLSVSGNDALLLADMNLDVQPFNISDTSVSWKTCTLRSWLNGYPASQNVYGKDYSKSGASFLTRAFNVSERNALIPAEPYKDTFDKVYLPGISEVTNPYYGFYGDLYHDNWMIKQEGPSPGVYLQAKNTTFVTKFPNSFLEGNKRSWWLRSSGSDSYSACIVSDTGYLDLDGGYISSPYYAIRPMLHLDLSHSNLWSYGGTVSSNGEEYVVEPLQKNISPTPTLEPNPTKPKAVKQFTVINKKKNTVSITWKKLAGAKGYQLIYATNVKFTKGKKTRYVMKPNAKISRFVKGKTYYFKIRAYVMDEKKKFYGEYSKVRKIKIKI